MSSSLPSAARPVPACGPARCLASMADNCLDATIFSSSCVTAGSWARISVMARRKYSDVEYGISFSKQSIRCRNRFLPERQDPSQVGLCFFQLGLFHFARLNEFRQRCLQFGIGSLAVNGSLQRFCFRAGLPEESSATGPLISAIITAAITAASSKHAAHTIPFHLPPRVHYLLDQRFHYFPFIVRLDFQIFPRSLQEHLLHLCRIEIASAATRAASSPASLASVASVILGRTLTRSWAHA